MKLLKLDPLYRNYLVVKHGLKLDAHGNEIMVGLTASESVEYLTMMNDISTEARFSAHIDPERFVTLYERHVAALPTHPSIFDTLGPSIW